LVIPLSVPDLRKRYGDFPYRKPDPKIQRPDLERGWLAWYLFEVDDRTWHRWEYWYRLQLASELPAEPIPQIEFLGQPDRRVWKLWEHIFNQVAPDWQGWSAREYIVYVLDWMLYGFGYHGVPTLPKEPTGCAGASDRLYQAVDIGPMLLWPYDYLGDLFAEMQIGKHAGFYPTPMSVVDLICRMTSSGKEDRRLESACDPAVGTGRMLLHQSNYCLSLSGQDISEYAIKACLVNGYLYAPWMVKPIQWIDARRAGEEIKQAPAGIKLIQGALL
jgi:hypothetical protein